MSRSAMLSLSAALLGASLAAASRAQPPGAGPSAIALLGPDARIGPYPRWALLNSPAVQEELKLTPAQLEEVRKGRTDFSQSVARFNQETTQLLEEYRKGRDAQGLPYEPDVERSMLQQRSGDMQALLGHGNSAGLDVLDRRQRARLDQI